jgi:hypothetical protein
MTVRVELVSGRGTDFDPPPGRVFLVGPGHTFSELADAINLHFARWDLSHLHDFRLVDGREIGFPDPDSPDTLDQARIPVASTLDKGDEFEFVFDFGDHWAHQCRVEEVGVDPRISTENLLSCRSRSGVGDRSPISTGVDQRTTPATTRRPLRTWSVPQPTPS